MSTKAGREALKYKGELVPLSKPPKLPRLRRKVIRTMDDELVSNVSAQNPALPVFKGSFHIPAMFANPERG